MSNQGQVATTVTNKLSGDKSVETIQFAITGDPHADLIAGLTAVSGVTTSRTGLSARQVQFAFEYLARLWKDAADANEKRSGQWNNPFRTPHTDPPIPPFPVSPWQTTCGAGSSMPPLIDSTLTDAKLKAEILSMWKAEQLRGTPP
jgi:hypothetical protein